MDSNCNVCGDRWYEDLDEEGRPYTCFACCNGTINTFKKNNKNDNNELEKSSEYKSAV